MSWSIKKKALQNRVFLLLVGMGIFFSACRMKEKVVYFQDAQPLSGSITYNPTIKCDDVLSILVMASDADAALPFNLPMVTGNGMMGGYTQGSPTLPGYLVDQQGNIDFPSVGKIHVLGLNRTELVDLLKERLSSYISNPSIIVRILNYKVTVLGEVKNPGTFTIPNERITILEAIGIAGDLQITAVRNNVMVIREVDGKRMEYRVDLTSKNLFSSPAYYLTQNDVVYVEPNRAKVNSAVVNATNVGIFISASSILISLLVLITQ
jgi:polysaccharide export outer membrane protein